jgi:hypothetical protein
MLIKSEFNKNWNDYQNFFDDLFVINPAPLG